MGFLPWPWASSSPNLCDPLGTFRETGLGCPGGTKGQRLWHLQVLPACWSSGPEWCNVSVPNSFSSLWVPEGTLGRTEVTNSLQGTHRWGNTFNYSANLHEVSYFGFPTGFHSQGSLGLVNHWYSVRFWEWGCLMSGLGNGVLKFRFRERGCLKSGLGNGDAQSQV